ncbi:hypothetical protein HYQ45_003613 [Verticillium longisporum]|uniref:Uncharacterized protein n=1 Tax=Verticillium longisporum TaxID=100787 RepID=A0A8I2ZUU3_VERLO|nr:hypothetical protein HYQ45_003613 [Verticillium longisporum]
MRLFPTVLGLLAAFQTCVAEISALEAARVLHYYVTYDLDVEVNGQGKNTIAQRCKGTGKDGRCNFNEFVNYYETGKPTSEPRYYEISSGFAFYPGDIAAIVDALRRMGKVSEPDQIERLVKGRKTAVGVFNDLAKISNKNYEKAASNNFSIGRKRANVMETLGSIKHYSLARGEGNMLDRLRKIRETVAANPDLANKDSDLFKTVAAAVKGERNVKGSLADQTIAQRALDHFTACNNS